MVAVVVMATAMITIVGELLGLRMDRPMPWGVVMVLGLRMNKRPCGVPMGFFRKRFGGQRVLRRLHRRESRGHAG
jgi:hypothetical protein